jgi:hypothetical protein
MSAAVASAVRRARDQDWPLHGPVWAWPVCQAAGCLSDGSDHVIPISPVPPIVAVKPVRELRVPHTIEDPVDCGLRNGDPEWRRRLLH